MIPAIREWWLSGKFRAFCPQGRRFDYHSRDLGQVFHSQLPVALRRVNSDTVSIGVQHPGTWLVKWRLSVPSVRKVVGSTPPLTVT